MTALLLYAVGSFAAFYVGALIGVAYGKAVGADAAFRIHLNTLKMYAASMPKEEQEAFFLRLSWLTKEQEAFFLRLSWLTKVGGPTT
jgi:hypothetical protein